MKKAVCFFALWIGFVILMLLVGLGCDSRPSSPAQPIATTIPSPTFDSSKLISSASELREEKIFLVTLEFKKEEFTLDLWELAQNEASAEKRVLIVGEKTFNEYQIGQVISRKSDAWGFVFNGELAEYVTRVKEKKVESQFFWITADGNQTELTADEYVAALAGLKVAGKEVLTTPFAGVVRNYILEKPLSKYEFVAHEPLIRYFVTVKVENSTLTFDLIKHIRNAANTHEIILEVPREIHEKTGEVWDPQISAGSLIFKGHLSELHGIVIKKWTEMDTAYQLVKTAEGREFILPLSKAQ